MKVVVTKTRDSVCAGDDADAPHTCTIEIDGVITNTIEFLQLAATGYLASVDGAGHSWTATLNGSPIATITVDQIQASIDQVDLAPVNTLHFTYHSARF